mmetsp:Transcript_35398/g.102196  ORF Transcript_35398/g.102196 Transcript_35398/m.102196 type:complete len:282 (+) Transcript_35398:207-1052(+)
MPIGRVIVKRPAAGVRRTPTLALCRCYVEVLRERRAGQCLGTGNIAAIGARQVREVCGQIGLGQLDAVGRATRGPRVKHRPHRRAMAARFFGHAAGGNVFVTLDRQTPLLGAEVGIADRLARDRQVLDQAIASIFASGVLNAVPGDNPSQRLLAKLPVDDDAIRALDNHPGGARLYEHGARSCVEGDCLESEDPLEQSIDVAFTARDVNPQLRAMIRVTLHDGTDRGARPKHSIIHDASHGGRSSPHLQALLRLIERSVPRRSGRQPYIVDQAGAIVGARL